MLHLGNRTRRTSMAAAGALMSAALVVGTPSLVGAAAADDNRPSTSPVVAQNEQGTMKAPVSGTTEQGHRVKGSFTPSEFVVDDGKIAVLGTVEGKILGQGKPKSFSKDVTMTVQGVEGAGASALAAGGKGMPSQAAISCDVLNLVLGPLDLNLLGLQVNLEQVVLDIVAVPGALLGDLLCAVSGLLSGGIVADLLNQIVGALNGILGALDA
jgi:hypothetical protein